MASSKLQRVRTHLIVRGSSTPVSEDLHEDLRSMVRGCGEIRSKGGAYSDVELSPYMKSLLQISGLSDVPVTRAPRAHESYFVAGV